ncbi:DUF3013 family protein [Streptococcus marimammalium]|uniref:DUF3013 family protein n=1 Tax=Streptococcus marimammalium TaxID=269666 RepID=UPI00037115FB|nr:DUF3013 family protein [Streptococcus marimammalium]
MAKYGFLSILEEELDKAFHYDYAINWNKKNHAIEVSFILEAQNSSGVETIDDDGQIVSEDITLEDFILFYQPDKSRFEETDYLVTIPYHPKKGFSREFLAVFANHLNEVATDGLSDLMDFLADDSQEEFVMDWKKECFEKELAQITETTFFPYPRY